MRESRIVIVCESLPPRVRHGDESAGPDHFPALRGDADFGDAAGHGSVSPAVAREAALAAPECAPPRPATASCRRHAAGVLNVERWGDVPAKSSRNRLWRVPSFGASAQRAFGRPASARSRLGPPLGGDRGGGGPHAVTPGRAGRDRRKGTGGAAWGVVARRGAGMLTAGHERPAATTGNEAKLVYGGRGAGGAAAAFRWMRDRGSWIPSWTRRNAGRFRPLSESWR